jgi:hypothetical protein
MIEVFNIDRFRAVQVGRIYMLHDVLVVRHEGIIYSLGKFPDRTKEGSYVQFLAFVNCEVEVPSWYA